MVELNGFERGERLFMCPALRDGLKVKHETRDKDGREATMAGEVQ